MTNIQWTDQSWNPVTGCDKVSPGCDNCYAEAVTKRFKHNFPHGFNVQLHPDRLKQPFRWRKPRRVFVNSMSDLFHPEVPSDFIAKTIHAIAATPRHHYQILTKRPKVAKAFFSRYFFSNNVHPCVCNDYFNCSCAAHIYNALPLVPPNIWLGTSVEDAERAMQRIPVIASITTPTIRFLSIEPLIEPIADTLRGLEQYMRNIDWIIVGGESGPNARPMQDDWVRDIRDIADAMNIPFFYKQKGGRTPKANGRTLDGTTHDAFPMPHPTLVK